MVFDFSVPKKFRENYSLTGLLQLYSTRYSATHSILISIVIIKVMYRYTMLPLSLRFYNQRS
ncbi:hypothetical protein M441DRAFT_61857 [Trichoderma asperellum CBS 433.97]|uniref:Uncharacterized protein n=1 Tax=Trichoderma asperellum (strain ATCC 204424 / CBS 433.97 / NBRC 101777) TaxID=1042311 RepID=A0A2T3YV33_TRIA4|nr:hypothetical protein M441DRAFT_61857 [Trichoderma asperellum CBS 433.97]PTB36389.1 hypothetical protein M441DRAFT_61857 [Trichoderma asperellum CBS 433.97]